MRFESKRVLVTGAAQGIGYEICRAFAIEGASVGLNDILTDLAAEAADKLNTAVGEQRVTAFPGDVADPDVVYAMVEQFSQRVGVPDVVVANAGVTKFLPFLESTPDGFDRLVAINLRGSYFLAQAAAKQMIAQQIPGRILLMSSVTGLRAFLNLSIYSMTKAALAMMAKSLALELGQYGITVNAISPGATLTERTALDDPNYDRNWATVSITGRTCTVADIANAALFLAAPESSQITGHNLVVDGGWTLPSPLPEDHPEMPDQ